MPSPHQRKVSFLVALLSFLIGTLVAFRVGQLSSNSISKFVTDNLFSPADTTCKVGNVTLSPQTHNDLTYECEIQKYGSFNVVSSHVSETYRLRHHSSELVFYEVFVQPAMFMHTSPQRVAIIGSGKGSAMKEVLKHKSVKVVKMIGVDENIVTITKKWNRCSDIVNGTEWCGDDDRVDFIDEDSRHWFTSRFQMNKLHPTIHNEEQFNVVIVDILNFPFVEDFYKDENYINSLFESVTDDGIIAFHIGRSSKYNDPANQFTTNSRRDIFMKLLIESGFQELFMYEDANAASDNPLFLLVAKDSSSRSFWFRNSAQSDLEILKRIQHSVSGKSLLEYFDGSVFEAFRAPHRVMESLYCRSVPMPVDCMKHKKVQDVPLSNLRVGPSSIGDGSGRGVFTDIDIKEGSTIARQSANNPINFPPFAYDLMLKYYDISADHEVLYNYMDGYGWESNFYGRTSYFVDSSILTFINHGCHGTYNIGEPASVEDERTTEQNATLIDLEEPVRDYTFNPFRSRHMEAVFEQAIRDIKAGEELFCDYTFFTAGKFFDMALDELKKMCNGEKSIGLITQVEMRKTNMTKEQ